MQNRETIGSLCLENANKNIKVVVTKNILATIKHFRKPNLSDKMTSSEKVTLIKNEEIAFSDKNTTQIFNIYFF